MVDAQRRLLGRLFYFAVVAITAMGIRLSALGADSQGGTSAATTTVSDTVFLADRDYGFGDFD